jgi:hypothetical protein
MLGFRNSLCQARNPSQPLINTDQWILMLEIVTPATAAFDLLDDGHCAASA